MNKKDELWSKLGVTTHKIWQMDIKSKISKGVYKDEEKVG